LFPQGNSNGQANDMVSVYLNYGDSKHAPENWHVCAQFALSISNPEDPTHFIQSRKQAAFFELSIRSVQETDDARLIHNCK
jgi:ubiquitin carboxyl-terminal hydrolase 7